jgi:hypothetical protein
MRLLALLLLLAAEPAAAQPPTGLPTATIEAMRRHFPDDHAALTASLAGKAPGEARQLAYAGIDRFLHKSLGAIAGAPGPALVALEARQGSMLRALQRQDVGLCAAVGDRGFFSPEALAGAPPPGLDEYGVALVEAAEAGSAASAAALPAATQEDYRAWMAAVERIVPDVPVRAMLTDRELRRASSPDHLCRGAAAMHEAVAGLPAGPGERVSRTLLRSVIGVARE